MYIIAEFSHKNGKDFILKNHPSEFDEIKHVIAEIDAEKFKTKISKEKTMPGKVLYSPTELNEEFRKRFEALGWRSVRINVQTFVPETGETSVGFREMDFVKNKLGLEIQFGKYAFMVYNVLAKGTIFARRGIIDSLVEVTPMKDMAEEMSTGVSFFEMVKTDLEQRGESEIDIPTLLLGVDVVKRGKQATL
jgi:hypothetical protein